MKLSHLSPQVKGLLLATLGVLAFVPDCLLVRLSAFENGAMLFWRGWAFFIGMTAVTYIQHPKNTLYQFKQLGRVGFCTGLLMGVSGICFVTALYHTSTANTLVIMSSSPMFAALYSRFFLKEQVGIHTLITMVIVVVCTALIVGDTGGNNSLLGNLIATLASMSMGGYFTLMRKGRDRNMVPATSVSGLVLITAGLVLQPNLTISPEQALWVALMGIFLVAGFALITLGTRYITSPEVGLLMPLETVFGSWLVWLVLGEAISTTAIMGGFAIIAALSVHSLISIKRAKRILQDKP